MRLRVCSLLQEETRPLFFNNCLCGIMKTKRLKSETLVTVPSYCQKSPESCFCSLTTALYCSSFCKHTSRSVKSLLYSPFPLLSCSLTLNSGQKASVTQQHLFHLLCFLPACQGSRSLSRGCPLCVAPLLIPSLSAPIMLWGYKHCWGDSSSQMSISYFGLNAINFFLR